MAILNFKRTIVLAFFSLQSAAAQSPMATESAQITVFQSKDMSMSAHGINKIHIFIDGKEYPLPANHFFTVSVSPGKHTVASGASYLIAKRVSIDLNVKAGAHEYLSEGLEVGLWQGRIGLHRVPCIDIEGRHLGQKLKPVTRDGVIPEEAFPEPVCPGS